MDTIAPLKDHMTDKTIVVTKHAQDRIKERLGLNKNAAARIAQKAYRNGVRHADTNGRLYRYICNATNTYKGTNIRIYGETVFVFKKNWEDDQEVRLITVFQIPKNLRTNALETHKKLIKARNIEII